MVVLMVLVLGCGGGMRADAPSELVGTWRAAGGEEPGRGWMKEYELRPDGTFVMTGYPPIRVTGSWSVPEREGARFRVVLTGQKMTVPPSDEASAWDDQDGWAVLEGRTLEWQGSRFARAGE